MFFENLDNLPEVEIVPGFRAKFIHSHHLTLAYWTIDAGSSLPEHAHHHEQVTTITKGKFELTVDGVKQIVSPGSVVVIPSNTRHSGLAITECQIIDVFYPVREDYGG